MDFAKPHFLYLLGLIPMIAIFLVWAAYRRRTSLYSLGTPSLITLLSENVNYSNRRWKKVLWYLVFISIIIALARPCWGSEVIYKIQEGVSVIIALDVSTSMLAEDIKPNRLTRAKLIIEIILRFTYFRSLP